MGPNQAMCQLPTWTENAIKFELKPSNKNGRENQTKTRWEWSGRHNENECQKY